MSTSFSLLGLPGVLLQHPNRFWLLCSMHAVEVLYSVGSRAQGSG